MQVEEKSWSQECSVTWNVFDEKRRQTTRITPKSKMIGNYTSTQHGEVKIRGRNKSNIARQKRSKIYLRRVDKRLQFLRNKRYSQKDLRESRAEIEWTCNQTSHRFLLRLENISDEKRHFIHLLLDRYSYMWLTCISRSSVFKLHSFFILVSFISLMASLAPFIATLHSILSYSWSLSSFWSDPSSHLLKKDSAFSCLLSPLFLVIRRTCPFSLCLCVLLLSCPWRRDHHDDSFSSFSIPDSFRFVFGLFLSQCPPFQKLLWKSHSLFKRLLGLSLNRSVVQQVLHFSDWHKMHEVIPWEVSYSLWFLLTHTFLYANVSFFNVILVGVSLILRV